MTSVVSADTPVPEVKTAKKSSVRQLASEKTKKIILESALAVFSDKGYDGSRVDEIALRTGLNKNVLYHHFGNKDGLFVAVLEYMYRIIRERQGELDGSNMEPVAGMRRLVVFTGRIWVQYPQFLRLLYSENMHEGRHVKESNVIKEMYSPLVTTISDLLERGQASGIFRKDIDPIDLYISVSALTAHYISNRYTLEGIFNLQLTTPQRVKHRLDHAADMIVRYLLIDPARYFAEK